jgi:ribA/ribD-fused uncharacterized protein
VTTTVVNLRQDQFDIYIGRPRKGESQTQHWGNPFSHQSGTKAAVIVSSREEAVTRFESWLAGETDHDVEPERREWIYANIKQLRGKVLGCFCKPQACHGDVLARLCNEAMEETMEERFIGYFTGEYHFLSNFAYVPHGVFGYKYNENWYQAAKFPKGSTRRDVIKGLKPGQAKRYAKQNEHEHRADWKEISLQVMFEGLKKKFAAGTELAQKLIDTGEAYLEEGNNWHDTFWGRCDGTCRTPHDYSIGDNKLGKMLMWIREELINGPHTGCFKCGGSGEYKWGSIVNGVPANTGQCYQCQGTGTETIYDRLRTDDYWNLRGDR